MNPQLVTVLRSDTEWFHKKFLICESQHENLILSRIIFKELFISRRDDEIIAAMRSNYHNPRYREMLSLRKKLPAWNCSYQILDELRRSQVLVVVGDTGCGKTTQVSSLV